MNLCPYIASCSFSLTPYILRATLVFYRKNPIVQTSGQLTWSPQWALIKIEDSDLRQTLESKVSTSFTSSPARGIGRLSPQS